MHVTVAITSGPAIPIAIPAGETSGQGTVMFPWPGVQPGDYLVRAYLGTSSILTATLHVRA